MTDPRLQVIATQQLGATALHLDELAKSFHRNLVSEARARHAATQTELAVVFAQAAAELCTEWAITTLFAARRDHDLAEPILDLFQVKDICNERVRAVYSALSKDQPQTAAFWSALKSHHSRRHGIVHRGATCTPAEAQASIEAVAKYLEHVEATVARVRSQ